MSTSAQAATRTPEVEISDLHEFFGELHVLRGIGLIVPPGSMTVLIGPSGSGKLTLLHCINELESIDTGRTRVDGDLTGIREAKRRRRIELHALSDKARAAQRARIRMVFQRFNLFPHATALQNVMGTSVLVKKTPRAKARERGIELLERVGPGDRLDHYPSQLSGGQQQRVAIAWILMVGPKLMLFDGPISALDPELAGGVLRVVKDLAASGMTMVVVTHGVGLAREADDQLIFMDGGVVVERGIPSKVLDRPVNERTRAFLSSVLWGPPSSSA